MANYVKATNFATKDTLPTGDSNKIVKGTEIDNEFNSIAGAVSSKADIASPTFTGTPAGPTATAGSNTTQLANTAYVKAAVDTGDALKTDKTTTITAGTGLTGGGDLSANRSIALANTAVTAGTYGSASELVQVVVDAQGRITSAQEFNLPAPSVITQQSYAIDTTHSISVSGTNRPIALTLSFSSNQSSDDTISVGFEWGLGGLTEAYTFFNSQRVNFQVSPSGTITVYLTPSATTTLQFRVNTSGGGWHFRNFFVSAIQL